MLNDIVGLNALIKINCYIDKFCQNDILLLQQVFVFLTLRCYNNKKHFNITVKKCHIYKTKSKMSFSSHHDS